MTPYSQDEFAKTLFTEEQIQSRIAELSAEIRNDYAEMKGDNAILAIGLMRGALPFMSDLGRQLDIAMEYELMWLSSYGDSDRPSEVELVQDARTSVEGRHVLLLEDIVDTGHTLKFTQELIESRNPASMRTCCLLDKKPRREVEVPVEYVGYTMEEDEFVVGYGLDYAGRYRNLPYIGILHPRMYQK